MAVLSRLHCTYKRWNGLNYIETKGGEQSGDSKNMDMQVGNKFNAFKRYAERFHLHLGFVRDKTEELFINNTEYYESMQNEN